jgi:hypothetical protein
VIVAKRHGIPSKMNFRRYGRWEINHVGSLWLHKHGFVPTNVNSDSWFDRFVCVCLSCGFDERGWQDRPTLLHNNKYIPE